MSSNYYLPIFGLFVGATTVLITLFALKIMIADQLELNDVLKEQVDELVEGFKEEIPVEKNIITDTLANKLKEFGFGEVARLTPAIKQKLEHKVLEATAILVGIGALFGFFAGLVAWWICSRYE